MKKKMVSVLLCAIMLSSAVVSAVPAMAETGASFKETLESNYIDPDRIYSSDVRWWLGEASNTDEVILDEIQALYDGGFRGVELCMQNDEETPDETYSNGS